MSELLDKQVNGQKESLKKLPKCKQASASPQKVASYAMKMKQNKLYIFLIEGRSLGRHACKTRVIDIKQLQVNDS